jgi:aspartate ammonia-lyase
VTNQPRSGVRTESDLLGTAEIPAELRYGIHTTRALANFPQLGPRVADLPEFCRALGLVKLAALRANVETGVLDRSVADPLERACTELATGTGDLHESLVVPLLQGGAGTSTNMNVNEVLANRALELAGLDAGSYSHCHPNDHVNRSQSTNDVYPTALRVALILRDRELVQPALAQLISSLRTTARRFANVPKLGRTQLQDAVPMTVDQEIEAWADTTSHAAKTLRVAGAGLHEINLGGTAIGTGLGAPAGYREKAVRHLRELSRIDLMPADRPVSATTDPLPLLTLSAGLRGCAVALAKAANDLRLLSSGPRTGLAEYELPARQAGSSMMPGKVNPVIPEFINQLSYRIRGLDATATMALDAGELQLNAMLPAVAQALFESQQLVATAAVVLAERCIDDIAVDELRAESFADDGLGQVTELAAVAGYAVATAAALSR